MKKLIAAAVFVSASLACVSALRHHMQVKGGNRRVEHAENRLGGGKRWHCGGKTYSDEDLIRHESTRTGREEPRFLDTLAARQRRREMDAMVNALKNPK